MKKKKKAGKPKNKRAGKKYPALDPLYNTKVRRENIDMDYVQTLNNDDKAWLNKFMEEYNGASFKNDGTDIHDTQELRRDCYGRNNQRNRCLYGVSKANGWVIDQVGEEGVDDDFEDRMIEQIDADLNIDAFHDDLEEAEESADTVDCTSDNAD